MQVDLGRSATVERVVLTTAGVAALPRHWHVERASDDGGAWVAAFDGAPLGVIGRDGTAAAAAGGAEAAGGGSVTQAVESGAHGRSSASRFWRITLRGYRGEATLRVDALRFYGRYADAALDSGAAPRDTRAALSDAPPPPSRGRSTAGWLKRATRAACTHVDRHYTDFHRVDAVGRAALALRSRSDAAGAADAPRARPRAAGAARHLGAVVVSTLYHLALTHSAALVYAAVALYHVANASLLSMPLPIVAVCYALVEYPRPAPRVWTWAASYVAFVLALKWAWQLPLFCQVYNTLQGADNAPYFALSAQKNAQWLPATAWDPKCPTRDELNVNVQNMRAFADSWMKLVGVYKSAVVWGGPSFQVYVTADVILLVAIALHRAVLALRGEAAADASPFVPFYRIAREGAKQAAASDGAPPPQSCSQGGCCALRALRSPERGQRAHRRTAQQRGLNTRHPGKFSRYQIAGPLGPANGDI